MVEDYGDVPSRVGRSFHKEIAEIQKALYRTHGFISSERITNLIVKHKKYWDPLKEDILNATPEEMLNAKK